MQTKKIKNQIYSTVAHQMSLTDKELFFNPPVLERPLDHCPKKFASRE
jgi:hypothetical protein